MENKSIVGTDIKPFLVALKEMTKDNFELAKKYYEMCCDSYYGKGVSLIEDYEFDMLERKLQKYCKDNNIVYQALDKVNFTKTEDRSLKYVDRTYPMTSLKNCYSKEELIDWMVRMESKASKEILFGVSPKFDGLSLNIEKDGEKFRFSLRGDGRRGGIIETPYIMEICKDAISKVESLLKAYDMDADKLDIRGEVVMPVKAFEEINSRLLKEGKKPYTSKRNSAVGILNSLSKDILKLEFKVWEVIGFSNKYEMFKNLYKDDKYWLPYISSRCGVIEEWVDKLIETYKQNVSSFPCGCDGLVFTMALENERISGESEKYPLHSRALKFEPEEVTSTLKEIIFTLNRTGILTPVGMIEPVTIGESKVSKVTLHNISYIEKKDLRIGDKVTVVRSGEVIPKILTNEHTENSVPYLPDGLPKTCPSCNGKLEVLTSDSGSKNLFCSNKSCIGQLSYKLVWLFSKGLLDVKGLGSSLASDVVKLLLGCKLNLEAESEDRLFLNIFYLDTLLQDEKLVEASGVKVTANLKKFTDNLTKLRIDEKNICKLVAGLGKKGIGESYAKKHKELILSAWKGESTEFQFSELLNKIYKAYVLMVNRI